MSALDWLAFFIIEAYRKVLALLQHIGTPFHELCHYMAAQIAGLKVAEFVPYYWLSRNRAALKAQGVLGYVKHEKANDEAVNIIVGAAPFLAFCIVLLFADANLAQFWEKALVSIVAMAFLIPSRKDTYDDFSDAGAGLMNIPLIIFIRLIGAVFSSNAAVAMAFHILLAIAILLFVVWAKMLVAAFLVASLLTLLAYRIGSGILLLILKVAFYLTFPLSTLFWAALGVSYYYAGTDHITAILGLVRGIWP